MNSKQLSLTIGIPTYNRRNKLEKLIKQFVDLSYDSRLKQYDVTISISDNASTDNTSSMVLDYRQSLEECGYRLKYKKQEHNLGMDGNFKYIYDNCDSQFLWYFSDDDILIPGSVVPLFEDLQKYSPAVCLSNFIQAPFSKDNTVFLSDIDDSVQVITDIYQCVNSIKKYPKLTNYIIKKVNLDRYRELIEDCVGFYYLHVVLALLVYDSEKKLLLRKDSIAKSDSDYMSIEYSPKAFSGLKKSVNRVMNELDDEKYHQLIVKEYSNDTLYAVLTYLILHYEGKIELSKNILAEEISYIKQNHLDILKSPKLYLKYLKYLIVSFYQEK